MSPRQVAVASTDELCELLASRPGPVHLSGRDTRRERLPAVPDDALHVSLRGLNHIERLEADDLTCSVQPGVAVRELSAELARLGVELGFGSEGDDGTIGGLYATDPLGAANLGQACPRSTLLGVDAVLANGDAFRAGARVVKSVAGFDVHKLLVGSRGLLFAATLLHLKLRPRPPASVNFATGRLQVAPAIDAFVRLRALSPPLRRLVLRRDGEGFSVEGTCAGRPSEVDRTLAAHSLPAVAGSGADHLASAADVEVVAGIIRPSRVIRLIEAATPGAPLLLHGGGHFEVALPPAEADRLLATLPSLDAAGAITGGAPDRRGRRSEPDRGAARLELGLAAALDPEGILR